ncbi:malonate--CoA ligase [Chelatococcus asaccharovorans]|uniref:malonate--CoA ligase n=1 Tax=Chelatococcus asaccharovorans TaxID=28210 RepID=UPI00224C79F6|nr:malonyl-CoA synthase [Chelatococcus asaccharovorans]CAH1654308.1 Malonyl-CoA/methylmalonyl-CoA synthetase [Chelatococcus asaccharovorans]CAH1694621.1 Malonyl-CoA/methylmalonyl-CoA synthetase [Chelatococcus asaccharovorans]
MTSHLLSGLMAKAPAADKPFIKVAGGRTITYGDLVKESARLAATLVELGVRPGDRVAVQVDKSAEAIVLYLATVRAGAIFLPLNTAYTLTELDYFLGDAEPRLVVCDPAKYDGIKELAGRHGIAAVETLDGEGRGSLVDRAAALPDAAAAAFVDAPRGADDLAAILYTSGTTGRSKGAMLSHDNLLSNALTLVDYWRFTDQDVLLHALPIFHTHGLFVATNTILAAGATMLFLPKFDADKVMALLPEATSMMGVPTFYTRLLQHDGLTRDATAHIRLFVSGSAPLLAETHREWRERTGHAILERYGMTETNMNTSNPYDGDRIAGTVGYPLPGVDLRVVDADTRQAVGPDGIGVIEVRGPNVFKGYWRNPEKTQEEFRADGFFITGDLGKVDTAGYVHIVGRAKDLIISGGFNVYPKEIEEAIDDLPGVVESAVIGLPHPDFGEGVVAAVVADPQNPADPATIAAALAERLAKFKQPKHVFIVDELPRNTMGKVQKNILRQRFADVFQRQVG